MIELLLINSLYIIGIYSNSGYSDDKPQVFYWLNRVKVPWWLKKPMIECVSCMASIHSLYIYWPFVFHRGEFSLTSLVVYLAYVPALAGLNLILYRITTMSKMSENDISKAVQDGFNKI